MERCRNAPHPNLPRGPPVIASRAINHTNKQQNKIIMHAINNFIMEFIFFPSAMLAYSVFMAVLIRSAIREWLKERKEKNDAKNKRAGE